MSDSLCQDGKHEWKQVYYGDECIKCGLFYVDGLAPWLMEDDDEDPLWYDRDDTEDCSTCDGDGGWLVCSHCHPESFG